MKGSVTLTRTDARAIEEALQATLEEMHQLMLDKEWFISDVVDAVIDAKQRLREAMEVPHVQ